MDPGYGNHASPLPLAFLQHELSQGSHIPGGEQEVASRPVGKMRVIADRFGLIEGDIVIAKSNGLGNIRRKRLIEVTPGFTLVNLAQGIKVPVVIKEVASGLH